MDSMHSRSVEQPTFLQVPSSWHSLNTGQSESVRHCGATQTLLRHFSPVPVQSVSPAHSTQCPAEQIGVSELVQLVFEVQEG
jgi:hypothetical protein